MCVVIVLATAAVLAAAGFAAAPARAAALLGRRRRTRRIRRRSPSSRSCASRPTSSSATSTRSPQLVFFGGSRSQRFDPAFARQRTGLSAVNISLSCARPEAAWGYLNWFYNRWPNAKVRWFWGMQSGMLRDRDLDPALLQDRRFYPYFPDVLLARQRALLPDSVAEMPHSYGFLRNRYSSRGLLLWNPYDQRLTAGLHARSGARRLHREHAPHRPHGHGAGHARAARTSSRPSSCSTTTAPRR